MQPTSQETSHVRVYLQPGASPLLHEAVTDAGAQIVQDAADASVIVWANIDGTGFLDACHDDIGWVQLPFAGIDRWLAEGLVDDRRVFTAAAGAYAQPVAEHTMALLLAATRRLHECARATDWGARWERAGATLAGATVGIVGAGGIGLLLIDHLTRFGARTIAVTRSGREVPTADASLAAADLDQLWPQADYVVLLAPSTPETRHLVGARELAAMRPSSWLVNVARGPLVDTDALLEALDSEGIAGAALDVTDPEPLPEGHPLWSHPRALITPHVACPPAVLLTSYVRRVHDNVGRFVRGESVLGVVDLERGY